MTHAPFADRPQPKPGVMTIEAYVPGKSVGQGTVAKVHKLSANENPLGPSPAAVEAARAAAASLELYPDGSSLRLREAIGETHGLDHSRVLAFNGSDEALALLARIYLGPGDEGLFSAHGFLAYRIYIQGTGAAPVAAAETNETANVDALLAAVTARTKIVFLANPNNPTGTWLPARELRRLHSSLPRSTLLVLDCAYAEFVRDADYEAGARLVDEFENVVMTRTFSKAHGLGGARIGWLYGPSHVVDALERLRDPFNVNAVAIAAGVAAMRDRAHVERSVAHVERWRAWLTTELTALGLRVTPSAGNFILIHFLDDASHGAAEADAFLSARGFILRAVAAYGFPNALRMSVGTEEANRGVVAALTDFLKA